MRLFQRRRSGDDFAAEIQAHLQLEADQLREEGSAAQNARPIFGNVAAAQEQFHESQRVLWLDHLAQDVRYALHTLRRAPGFTCAAILSLALGIGANTAIFSTVDEVLLRPVDVPAPHQLAQVYSFNRKTAAYVSSSYADYQDFRQRAQSFQNLAAYVRLPLSVALGESAEQMSVEAVTGNYFAMLRLPALAGRALGAEDDRAGAPAVAMVAEDVWRRRFQADPAFVGKSIRIEGVPFTVAGIVPKRLAGLNLNWATPPEVWIPLHTTPLAIPLLASARIFENRSALWLVVTGRLKPGVSMAGAQAELQTIAGNLARTEATANRDFTVSVFPLSHSKFWPSYRNSVSNSLTVFGVACGLILLLACANVSNLLLERALSRRREFAVRLAIGAGRARLIRQLLTESLTLAAPSCAAALLVAWGLMKLLLRFPNALGLPLSLALTVEWRAVWFCVLLSLGTTVLFGLAPALQATQPGILPSLKQSGNATQGGQRRLRGFLVTAQVALSTVLLIGGGLYGRSLLRAYEVDLGFRKAHLLTAAFTVAPPGADAELRQQQAQRALLQQLSQTPGVLSATTSAKALLSPVRGMLQVGGMSVDREFAGPDYFKTMGIGLLSGRDFSQRDDTTAARVAIVNQALAARLWPQGNPVGATVSWQDKAGKQTQATVLAVAHDAKYGSVWEKPQPRLYLASLQSGAPAAFLAVWTAGPPAAVAPAIREAWAHLAPALPIHDFQTADERVDLFLMPQRVAAGILGAFGLLAICLAAVGLYSLVSYSVVEQRREIGIRIALGAQPRTVVAGILRRSLLLTAAGLSVGAGGSLVAMRFLAHQITQVTPYDGVTYGVVALVLGAVAFASALIPASRAMRTDPCTALRCQ